MYICQVENYYKKIKRVTIFIVTLIVIIIVMGRTVGFEPTHIGTTIRGLNRLAMPATSFFYSIFKSLFCGSFFSEPSNLSWPSNHFSRCPPLHFFIQFSNLCFVVPFSRNRLISHGRVTALYDTSYEQQI